MRWVTQSFGTDQPAVSVQVPTGWKPYHAFVGQTGGTEWVNPADPSQRIAVVLDHCMSCQQPELTRNPTVQKWLTDSTGSLVHAGDTAIQRTSITDNGQQGYFTDTAHIDDFCLNGDPDNPAWGQTHEPYVALGYVHLAQKPIVEPVEVFAWAPTASPKPSSTASHSNRPLRPEARTRLPADQHEYRDGGQRIGCVSRVSSSGSSRRAATDADANRRAAPGRVHGVAHDMPNGH